VAGTTPPQAMPKIAAELMSKKRRTGLREICKAAKAAELYTNHPTLRPVPSTSLAAFVTFHIGNNQVDYLLCLAQFLTRRVACALSGSAAPRSPELRVRAPPRLCLRQWAAVGYYL
jgi:hypothetical protein